ncbi:unnamed protein product [Malus baccata var. baccata]
MGLDQIFTPLRVGFAVFLLHLATIRITGNGNNPARSLLGFAKNRCFEFGVSCRHLSSGFSLLCLLGFAKNRML